MFKENRKVELQSDQGGQGKLPRAGGHLGASQKHHRNWQMSQGEREAREQEHGEKWLRN